MSEERLEAWLRAYGQAWTERDAAAAAALWADDGEYHWGPFVPPILGRAAIREVWELATSKQRDISFGAELFGITARGGIARWWCALTLVETGAPLVHEGIFLIVLDEKGLCTLFQEWWIEDPPPAGPTDRLYRD